MKILLVGNFSADAQFSMQGFVHALAQGLPAQSVEVKTIAPTPVLSSHCKNVHGGIGKWLAYVDKYVLFPPRLRRAAREVDLVHICDQGNGIYVSQLGNRKPVLLTCHDLFAVRAGLGDPQTWPLSRTGKIYQKLIWNGIRQAENIACVSEATRADLIRLLAEEKAGPLRNKFSLNRITCVLNGLYKPCERMAVAESREVLRKQSSIDAEQPFLLHVGGNQTYKNRLGLLKIYAAMRQEDTAVPPLVLAGKPFTQEMRRFVVEYHLEECVWERSGLSDETLRALYSQAEALIFPSTMEGFGLPILEAQACGCPVFTTGLPPMTEAGGDAAVYIDLHNPDEAARVILRTLRDVNRRNAMVRRGLDNVASRFTTSRMISDYHALYTKLLMEPGRA